MVSGDDRNERRFRDAERALMGGRWSADQAAQLQRLIWIGAAGEDYSLDLLVAVKQALYAGGAPDPELEDARQVLQALAR